MLPLKILGLRLRRFIDRPGRRRGAEQRRGMPRQSNESYDPKRSEGGLARAGDDALSGHAFLEHARPLWSPIESSGDVTETIELVAAPNSRRQHATG
jgi:hypothetical protein